MALTYQRQKQVLYAVALGFLSAAVLIGYLTMRLSPLPIQNLARLSPDLATNQSTETQEVRSVELDPQLWKRSLRQPLYDPPPPPPPVVVKKVLPPLRSKLLGTIIEPGASKAMIQVPGRGVQFREEGEPLGPHDADAVLTKIGPSSITVTRGEEVTELKVESPY